MRTLIPTSSAPDKALDIAIWRDWSGSAGRAISLRITLALILVNLGLASSGWADYEAGVEAYQRRDYTIALQEWLPLAELGHAEAQYKLGLLYHFKKGVPQDFVMARRWYEKAAAQGHGGAQSNLGELYKFGHGVLRDFVVAYMWYQIASMHSTGDPWRESAAENRDELAGRMSSAQIAESQMRAREWRAKVP